MAKVIHFKKHRVKPKYKYTLNEQVGSLPRNTSINDVIIHLEKEGITRNEFYGDRSIPFGSDKSIPDDRMVIYSQVFDCTVDALRNQKIKAKSLREEKPTGKKIKSPLS